MTEFFLNIVNMSISAGWIVLAVLILRLLLKKAPKWITVLLWGIVAFRLICPFSIESALSLIPSTQTINPEYALNSVEIDSGIPIIDNTINPIISGAMVTVQPEKDINFFHIIMPYLTGLWLVGVFALLLYTVISYVRLKKKIGTAVLYKDNIFQSESVISPFVLGIIKPKIYLPFNMTDSDMENVVAHEQAHIKRKDHLWKPLGFLLLTIHWFNPLMWVGYIMLCKDIELACDEKVVKNLDTEQRADYSQALLSCSVNRRMIAACPLAFGEVGVKSRIKTVLNYKKPAFWIIIIAIIASIVAAVCFLTNPTSSNTMSKLKIPEAPNLFDNVTEIQVTIPEMYFDEYYVNDYHFILDFLQDIEVSKKEISKSRSEDRAKEYNVILKYGDTYEIIHFDKECKEFWINNDVKPSFSYRVIDNEAVKAFFEKLRNQSNSNKITWTYNPTLSYTGHYTRGFVFDFDYTHVEATCTEGEMWNFDVEGQPRDTAMRFEKGKNVYWTPSEAVIEKLPKKSEVTLTIFNNKTQLYKCTVIFECVSRDLGSAEFEIYFKKSDGLGMVQSGEGILLFENSSISNVGGVDAINGSNSYLPRLHVSYGDLKVRAWTGTASWTFTNENGTAQSINADSSHPLEMVEYIKPWAINIPNRKGNPILVLDFDVVPDSIKSNGWFFTEKGKTKSFDPIVEGMTIVLNDSSEPCLYEVVATWDSSKEHFGTIRYKFYVSSNSIVAMSVKEIVDRTVTEGIATDDAEQPFFIDENYIYSFPSMRSEFVIVTFDNGDKMTVQHALSQGLISISILDKWDIKYIKKEYNGELELDENGNIVWVSSYPQDLYHSPSDHLQTLFEETPIEQQQEKYNNEEFVITKMHYVNKDKKWCANGHTYLFRLEITGRMNNSEKNTTYIVLSNNQNITFEQTWKASGLSSLSTDYFKPEEAVIVGHKLFS